MKQLKFISRAIMTLIFYLMSPFCSFNNPIEVDIMDKLATLLQKLPFFLNIKIIIISTILYAIYNILSTLGFMSLSNSKEKINWKKLILEIFITIGAYYSVKYFLKGYMTSFTIIFSIGYGVLHYKRNKKIYKDLFKKTPKIKKISI